MWPDISEKWPPLDEQEPERLGGERDLKKLCQIMTDIFNEGQVWEEQRTT